MRPFRSLGRRTAVHVSAPQRVKHLDSVVEPSRLFAPDDATTVRNSVRFGSISASSFDTATTRSAKVLFLSNRTLFRDESKGDNAFPLAMDHTLSVCVSLKAAVDLDFTLALHEQK
jgi:hypothetical protein